MKIKLFFLSLLLFSLFSSCGNDDSETSLSSNESFDLTIEGEKITIVDWQAIRIFDNIEIIGTASDDRRFYIKFNENGFLDRADFNPDPNWFDYSTSYYNPKETFIIRSLAIDESNKIVNISFNGILYEDDFDVFSPSSTLEVENSTINVKFVDNPNANNPDLDDYIDATINGISYESVKYSQGGIGDIIEISGTSDGIENLSIIFNRFNNSTGTYIFDSSSLNNAVLFSTYNPFASEFPEEPSYQTTGILSIEEFIPASSGQLGRIKGTFEMTAVSDNRTYTITNGEFNKSFLSF